MQRIFVVALFFLILLFRPAWAVDHWWVGGGSSANWNATVPTNWSIVGSGGAGGATVPTVADNVFFDANSGSGTATISAPATAKSIDCNNYTGTLAFGSQILTIGDASNTNGIVRWGSGMTITFTLANGALNFGGSSGSHNFTSNGRTSPNIGFGFPSDLVFKDDFVSTDAFGNAGFGTIDAADSGGNHNITAKSFDLSNGIVLMGNGTWTATGTGTVWTTTGTSTVTKGSSTIKLTANSASSRTFAGGGRTFNNFWHAPGSGAGQLNITGANTFADFKDDGTAAHTIRFPISVTQTFTSFTVSGNSGQLISIISATAGTAATLSDTSGTICSDFLSIKDSTATGGASWFAGANSTNVSGNTGWTFTACSGAVAGAPMLTTLGAGR